MSWIHSLSREMFGHRAGRVLPVKLAGGLPIVWAAMLLAVPALASHETPPEREVWYLVRQRCYLCHYLDQPGGKFAPSLKDLFKRQNATLINGKPINDQTVSEWIAEGSPNMPAFQYTLTPRQIQLIVTYLKGGFPKSPKQDGTYPQQSGK